MRNAAPIAALAPRRQSSRRRGRATHYLSGHRTRITNPRGYQTTTSYQTFDSPSYDAPTTISEPGGVNTSIGRDVFGKPRTITRSGTYLRPSGTLEFQNQSRTFVYDAQQRLCKRVDAESGATIFDYDAAGNLAWSARSTGLTSITACQRESVSASEKSVRTYDARNRLTNINHPTGTEDVSYSYEADGALSSASTPNGGTWTYSYNKRRLPTGESLAIDGTTFTLGYGYTALGHVGSMTYPGGLNVAFAPNALGQPTQAGSYATGATYHPDGSLKGFTYGNGLIHTRAITPRGLPYQIRDRQGTASRLEHFYSYDEHGNLTQITDTVDWGVGEPDENRSLTYDARDRLEGTLAMGKFHEHLFEYDALDNLRRAAILLTPSGYAQDYRYQYSGNWRLQGLVDATGFMEWQYSVDGLGQTTRRQDHYQNRSWDYGWNAAGQMTSAGIETYRYDAHGRRTRSTRPGGVRYQVYNRAGQLVYTQDTEDNQRIEYLHLAGRPVAQRSRPIGTGTVTTRYLHTDQRGSVNLEADTWGTQRFSRVAI